LRNSIPQQTNNKLLAAGTVLNKAITNQASLQDEHTLKWLADHGHPYSTKYGKDYGPHGNDSLVHTQSGRLLSAIEMNAVTNNIHSEVEVGVSPEKVPYIGDLIKGNGKMRPRDFISAAAQQVRPEIDAVMGEKK
jgi:hypothetical protein